MTTLVLQSFHTELISLLETWRTLSESERVAIESSEWEALKTFQVEKTRLQVQIDSVLKRIAERSISPSSNTRLLPLEVAERVTVLKRLEQDNRDLLDRKLILARSSMTQVNASVRHLRQVHQAYSRNTSGIWESYS